VHHRGLDVLALESVEGIAFAHSDLEQRLADPRGARGLPAGGAAPLVSVPELLGLGPHLLATARRPGSDPERRA
jgi:hypothetical protein